jgi:hypothetical protein
MGLLERSDQRNQRTADWQNELGRRNPSPKYGRSVGAVFVGMFVLAIVRRLVVPSIGAYAWLALLAVCGGVCFGVAIALQKRRRRVWEESHPE